MQTASQFLTLVGVTLSQEQRKIVDFALALKLDSPKANEETDVEKSIRRLAKKGQTISQIADELNLKYGQVQHRASKMGVKIQRSRGPNLTKSMRMEILNNFENSDNGRKEAARKYGVSISAIDKIFKSA